MKKIYLFITLCLMSGLTWAGTITVTSTGNSGAGTLRQALADAASGDTINFSITGIITLASELDISKDITITGPGADQLILDGNSASRIFMDGSYTQNKVEISGLGMRNAYTASYGAAIGGLAYNLTIRNCDIYLNYAGNYGGAISVWSGDSITKSSLLIENSSIRDNETNGYCAAIYMQDVAALTIHNSTICNNFGINGGAAILVQGSPVELINVTIADNAGQSIVMGEDYIDPNPPNTMISPTITMQNCIFDNGSVNYNFFSPGGETSLGHNISNDNSMINVLTATGDLNNTPSGLDPNGEQDNGGSTITIALDCNSPAINAGALVFATDQLGNARQGAPDIGAYESSIYPTSSVIAINPPVCHSFLSPSGKYTWTESGIHNDTIPNSFGCDSVMSISVDIFHADTTVLVFINELQATATLPATFLWLDCNALYSPVNGGTEINSSFDPTVNGSYAVQVTQEGCSDTSSCYTFINVGLPGNAAEDFSLFPNPAREQLTVKVNAANIQSIYTIYDAQGKVVVTGELTPEKTTIDLRNLSEGLYLLSMGQQAKQRFVVSRN